MQKKRKIIAVLRLQIIDLIFLMCYHSIII